MKHVKYTIIIELFSNILYENQYGQLITSHSIGKTLKITKIIIIKYIFNISYNIVFISIYTTSIKYNKIFIRYFIQFLFFLSIVTIHECFTLKYIF